MKTPSKRGAPAPKAGKTAKGPIAPAAAGSSQAELFAQAAGLFHSGRFGEAKALFEAASKGAIREMTHSARLHIRMCDQRLGRAVPELATAEERYNYAVALMNRREFQAARQHLEQAVRMSSGGDHLHYALALCLGALGDLDGAGRHLRRAIEIHPRNRAMARSDPDFADLVRRPPLSELLAGGQGRS
jgi:tetratricopeptide (TPR) repeat protein